METFFETPLFYYVILPLLIAIARIVDVSLGTVRIIFISKGYKKLAPIIGFFEVLIWIIAIGNVMKNLENWICFFAYAAGFATGNYVGMLLEEKMALGYEMIRVITKTKADELIRVLRTKGYGTTQVKASGSEGEVAVLYIVINRKRRKSVIEHIKTLNPQAFYTIEDLRFVNRELDFFINNKEADNKSLL